LLWPSILLENYGTIFFIRSVLIHLLDFAANLDIHLRLLTMATILEDYKYEGKQIPMEEIRVLHLAVGPKIPAILQSTFKIFTPGLLENTEKIRSIEPTTETYGPHARHKLDIYLSSKEDETSTAPILVYFYGGGLVRGDKKLAAVAKGLMYHNLGTFFASRGITTLVPDYRRVNSKDGGEDAVCFNVLLLPD
jgi:acetyl esterase/lipase